MKLFQEITKQEHMLPAEYVINNTIYQADANEQPQDQNSQAFIIKNVIQIWMHETISKINTRSIRILFKWFSGQVVPPQKSPWQTCVYKHLLS